jgi:hypothetical protein
MAFKAVAATILAAAAVPAAAHAAPVVSSFTVTPSTTQAGGHPSLVIAFSFAEPTTGVKQVALHLPAGLTAQPRAIPFCGRLTLLQNLCLPRSKAGSLSVTAVAYGFELAVTRSIYNVRPRAGERVRMGVPILGSYSEPGIAAEVPLVQRPADGGLDMTVTGLPTEVAGVPVRFRDVQLRIRASGRVRVKSKLRRRLFLTNPLSCTPATSTLAITLQESPTAPLTSVSSFTPTGC